MREQEELLDKFTKLRDVSDRIVKAIESEDEEEFESAMGRFIMLMVAFGGDK